MFYLDKKTTITTELLYKMINRFRRIDLPKMAEYEDYYKGFQAIGRKQYNDESKPCNRTVTNYCKNICNSYAGYISAPGHIAYNSDTDISDIMDVLKYNDYAQADSKFTLDLLKYGKAAELMYMDENSHVRFKLISPLTCFAVYSSDLNADMLYFVRWYKLNDWDNSDTYAVDVYNDKEIMHYKMIGVNGGLTFQSNEPHYFSQVPANIAEMPDNESVFACIMDLQDAYNEVLSGEIDDFSAFCDSYLKIIGADLESTDVQSMKENRVLVLPEGASADWLTKQANDSQIENILKRIQSSIYRIAQCPDFSNETFGNGVSSGIALQFRLTNMETKAASIVAEIKMALQRRIEIICGVASLMLGEDVFRDIDISFTRNIPTDTASIINIINSLKGTISDETLISQVPFVTDVQAELDKVNKQKQDNIAMFSFGGEGNDE